MPPVCTVGYSIATGNFKFMLGASYLFFINCSFIMIATYIGTSLTMVKNHYIKHNQEAYKMRKILILVSLILIIPSLVSLAIVGLITLTLYLTWTPVGNFEVLGVQGRYYLGVVALSLPVICSLFKQRISDEQRFTDHFVVESSLIIIGLTILQTISVLYAVV